MRSLLWKWSGQWNQKRETLANTTIQRPPLAYRCLLSHVGVQFERCASPGMDGTAATPARVALGTRSIPAGGSARSSSMYETKFLLFLSRKWARELDYRLIRKCGCSTEIALLYASLTSGTSIRVHWYRSCGNENREFTNEGLMGARFRSINDLPITRAQVSLGARASAR